MPLQSNQREDDQHQEILRHNLAGQNEEKLLNCLINSTIGNSSLVLIASLNDHNLNTKSPSSYSSLNPAPYSKSIPLHSPELAHSQFGIHQYGRGETSGKIYQKSLQDKRSSLGKMPSMTDNLRKKELAGKNDKYRNNAVIS